MDNMTIGTSSSSQMQNTSNKTIIEHGYTEFTTRCNVCRCLFKYHLSTVDPIDLVVSCPECKSLVNHNVEQPVQSSKIKDEKQ